MSNKQDYLNGTNIYLWQRKDMFRCNTDTALLGQFIHDLKDCKILDIGCNNGALMLYASLHDPYWISGIDIFEEAIELASKNLIYNNISNFSLYCCDINDFENDDKYDVIISNPPYFATDENGNINENHFLYRARHEGSLNVDSLFANAKRLLVDGGRLFLVHRASRIDDLLIAANKYNFYASEMKFIYDENKDNAVSVLLMFNKGKNPGLVVLPIKMIKR